VTTGRRWFALPILLAALVGCGKGDTRPASRFISIATGGSGGVYYPYGGGLAKILNDKLPDVRATAEVTAASVDNHKLIRDGRADIAFTLADTLADAIAGRGPFSGRAVPAVSLAVLYSNYTHIVTLASSNIRQVSDLRGHTLSTGSPGSGTEITAVRLLSAAGIDPDLHPACDVDLRTQQVWLVLEQGRRGISGDLGRRLTLFPGARRRSDLARCPDRLAVLVGG